MSTKESSLPTLKCQVLIVGGGLCGVATAIALRKSGHEITVFERMPTFVPIGAGIQLSPNCTRLFQHWRILQEIMTAAYQPDEGTLRSYKGHTLSKQDSGAIIEANYNAPYLVIHRADLLNILVAKAQELGVEIRLASVVRSIDFEKASIKLINGEVFTGDVVLGADGERSICRDAILEHPDIPFTTGDVVFRLAIPGKELPQTPEILALTKPPSVNLWLGPKSHAVSYLLKRDDIFNIVLVCRDNPDAQVMYGPQPVDRNELLSKFAEWEPLFADLLKVEKATLMKWSLLQINEVKNWRHPSGKFALIGDAAHAMLPYLAQGGAQAFEDAAVLGTLFSTLTDFPQISEALRIYESIRKPRTLSIQKQIVVQKSMYEMEDGPNQEMRDKKFAEPGNSPDCLENAEFQSWLWGYDAVSDAKKAWNEFLS